MRSGVIHESSNGWCCCLVDMRVITCTREHLVAQEANDYSNGAINICTSETHNIVYNLTVKSNEIKLTLPHCRAHSLCMYNTLFYNLSTKWRPQI